MQEESTSRTSQRERARFVYCSLRAYLHANNSAWILPSNIAADNPPRKIRRGKEYRPRSRRYANSRRGKMKTTAAYKLLGKRPPSCVRCGTASAITARPSPLAPRPGHRLDAALLNALSYRETRNASPASHCESRKSPRNGSASSSSANTPANDVTMVPNGPERGSRAASTQRRERGRGGD